MVVPDYIVRTNRRSLSLIINKKGELIIKAPRKMSMPDILSFIKDKEQWVNNKKNKIQNILKINYGVINYRQFLFCGKVYNVVGIDGIKKIEISDNCIYYPKNIIDEEKVIMLKRWYVKIAKEVLPNRVEYFAKLTQIDYNLVTISNSKNRWGSCDIDFNIKLNFRLMMLPHKIIDFVILHELCHILEFNHSKNFYKILSGIMPDYKSYQSQLKEYDYILQLYR